MLVSNLQLKLNVVNLCNASRRRMHNASCTRRIHGSNFVESTPCGSMTFSHSIGFTAGNCVASLCVYLVLINVNQSCKSLCSQYLSTCIQATLYRTLSRVTSTRCLLMSPLCSGKREFLGERMIFTKFKGSKRFYRQATSKWIQSNWKRRIELFMYRHRYIGWIGYTHDQIDAIESTAEKLPQFPWLNCQSHSHSRNQLRSNRLSLLSGA